MIMKHLVVAGMAAAMVAATPVAAESIGTADRVGDNNYRRAAGFATTPLDLHQRVWEGDHIITDFDGQVGITLDDDTRLSIGPRTILEFERYFWDADTGIGDLQIDIDRGVTRIHTAMMPDRGVGIDTPTAFIGVRGTDFLVFVNEAGRTMVAVLDGVVSIHAVDGPETAVFGPQTVGVVDGAGELVQVSVGVSEELFSTVLNFDQVDELPTDEELDDMMNRLMTGIY